MIKVISFDMDGTLVSEEFDNLIWNEDLPKFYAKENNISIEEAKDFIFKKYEEHKGNNKWTSLDFWFNMFNLKDWQKLIEKNLDKIEIYPETIEILKKLKNYKLIVTTQAPKEFFDVKMKNLTHFFDKLYSSTHHYNKLRKDQEVYKEIIKDLNVKPEEILHIGNNKEYDYDAPTSLGIKAVLLDRENKHPQENTIKSLKELFKQLK